MRVISPRRSSTTAAGSGSLYGTSTSTTAGTSSGSGLSSYHSSTSATSNGLGLSKYSTHYDRASSLSKVLPSSSTTSSYSSSSYHSPSYSTYTPRTSTHRSSLTSGTSASSYLSGGATSGLGSYHRSTSSYLSGSGSGSSYDSTTLSRYGLPRKTKGSSNTAADSLRKDDYHHNRHEARKPPTATGRTSSATALSDDNNNSGSGSSETRKRLSGSCSSSSLARLVATSGLDMYEKYSPANYKSNCELSRSRSAVGNESTDNNSDVTNNINSNSSSNNSNSNNNSSSNNISTTCTVTLDRPRSRYSRLYGNDTDVSSVSGSASTSTGTDQRDYSSSSNSYISDTGRLSKNRSSGKFSLSNSGSNGDIPTATFTLRSNRPRSRASQRDQQDVTASAAEKSPSRASIVLTNGTLDYMSNGSSINDASATKTKSSTSINGIDGQMNGLKLTPTSSLSSLADKEFNKSSNNISTDTTDDPGRGSSSIAVPLIDIDGSNSNSSNDVSTTATIKLDANGGSPTSHRRSSSKVRNSGTTRGLLPPTGSRYLERDSSSRSSALPTTSLTNKYTSSAVDDALKTGRDEKAEGLCGLKNIGNTCFMNSVIQCLSHTTELTRFLRSYHGLRTANTKDQQILYEFAKLIQEMWTTNVHSVTPIELKRAFSTKHRMYSDCNQQDAQEFLRFFLDSLHSALNTGIKNEPLNIDDNLSDNKKADLNWEWYSRHENSLIRDLFVGQLKSTLKCTSCGNTSVTFDPFWDLSVPLPSSSRCRLEACLDLFIREEVLDGDEMPTCAKCKTRRKCTKSFTIQRFPKYLVIHLKRFSETRWSKLSNMVEVPSGDRELNMAPYAANASSSVNYSLYAISNHMGSTAGGHYVAVCRHPVSRKWHEFNDNVVSEPLNEHSLISPSAYILFYERA